MVVHMTSYSHLIEIVSVCDYSNRETAIELSKVASFNLLYLSGITFGVILFEFCQDLWHRETTVPGLSRRHSWGVVCVIPLLAVSV